MVFDLNMIKNVYAQMASRIEAARNVVGKPLSLTEKILYAHLDEGDAHKLMKVANPMSISIPTG